MNIAAYGANGASYGIAPGGSATVTDDGGARVGIPGLSYRVKNGNGAYSSCRNKTGTILYNPSDITPSITVQAYKYADCTNRIG